MEAANFCSPRSDLPHISRVRRTSLMSVTVPKPNGTAMSDLERYLTSKLNGQYGLRYQQLLDELRAIQKGREVSDRGSN